MTVCLASFSREGFIVGASDRMVTYDGITFEPPISKIWLLTPTIVIMTSGDSALQAETLNLLEENIANIQPLSVKKVVDLYVECRNSIIRYRSQNAILEKFGLTHQDFLSTQKNMNFEFVNEITREIMAYKAPVTGAIITGLSDNKPWLYTIHENKTVDCMKVGYACIGSGGRHARLQLMLAGHSRVSSLSETLLLIYIAKKRSEISTGVGSDTDMFVMGPNFTLLNKAEIDKLQLEFKKISQKEKKALKKSFSNMENYVNKIIQESKESKTQDLSSKQDLKKSMTKKIKRKISQELMAEQNNN